MKPTAIAAQASVGIVGDVVTERVHKAVLSATTRGGRGGGRGSGGGGGGGGGGGTGGLGGSEMSTCIGRCLQSAYHHINPDQLPANPL